MACGKTNPKFVGMYKPAGAKIKIIVPEISANNIIIRYVFELTVEPNLVAKNEIPEHFLLRAAPTNVFQLVGYMWEDGILKLSDIGERAVMGF